MDKFKNTYISFAPRIRIEWTPGLYYYMNGKRKINLHSLYPTFSVDYERGIKGVFKSTGEYERIEFDLQHQIRLGLMRNIYYRFGFEHSPIGMSCILWTLPISPAIIFP